MSRRRKKQAVPEEILAEGSGPVAGAEALAEAASELGVEAAPEIEPTEASAPIEAAAESTDVEAIEEAPPDALEEISEEEAEELAAPATAAAMDSQQLKLLVESLVFASDKPITVQRLRQLTRVSDVRRLEQALADLAEDYKERGIVLQQVSGGYQFRTRTQFSSWVQQLIAGRPVRLSRAQLETLAIIAYRQPITRPEIDEIRGVDSSATLKLLLDRALIRILGKKEEVGRPMLYGTTKEFLDFFSLGDLRELPTLREYSELTDESRQVMSDRLGIDPDAPADSAEEPAPVEEAPRPASIEELVASYAMSMPEDATDARELVEPEVVMTANIVASVDVDTAGAVTAAVMVHPAPEEPDDDAEHVADAPHDEAAETTVFEARDEAATTGVFIVESDDEDRSDVTLVDPEE